MHTEFGLALPCRGAGCFQCAYTAAIERWNTTTETSPDARRAVMAEFIEPVLRLCPTNDNERTWPDNPPNTPVYRLGPDILLYACKLFHQERTGVAQDVSRLCAPNAPNCGFLRDDKLSTFAKLQSLTYNAAHMFRVMGYTMDPVLFVRGQYLSWASTPPLVLHNALSRDPDDRIEDRLRMFMAAGDDESVHRAFQGLRADIVSGGDAAALRTLDKLHAATYTRPVEIAVALHSRGLNADLISMIALPTLPARFVTPFELVAQWAPAGE